MTHSHDNHMSLAQFERTMTSDAVIWREVYWGDMRVNLETYLADFDDRELLKGLPDDRCQCPHWGYLLAGRMTVHYANHNEIIKPGEVYYMAPGHTMSADAGTVLIEFSPKDKFRELLEIAEKNFERKQNTPRSA